MGPSRKQQEQIERNRYERSWAMFERRDKWRQCLDLYRSLSAAQMLRLRRDYPEAYAWLKENA